MVAHTPRQNFPNFNPPHLQNNCTLAAMKDLKQGDRVQTGNGSGTIDGFVVGENGEITALVLLDDEDAWCIGATAWIEVRELADIKLH